MLDYEWGNVNPSSIMLSGDETDQNSELNFPVFDQYASQNFSRTTSFINPETHFAAIAHHHPSHHPQNQNPISHFPNFFDPRAYTTSISSYARPDAPSIPAFDPTGLSFMPKSEPMVSGLEFNTELNLGGRTYFSNSEDDLVNRLYRRSRLLDTGSINSPHCQAEGCNADLTHAKHYHRRHKVCEFHSKAATVIAAGLTQRFCQQCSRFHLLSEFDNGKRSCRRRLADHNRRRRKSMQTNQQSNKSQERNNAPGSSSDQNLDRSPPDSGPSSYSLTVAVSPPPRILLDCFGHRSYTGGTTASTSSLFYSN